MFIQKKWDKKPAKVNTLLASTLVIVSMHSSAFAVSVSDNIAQLLAATAEITLGLSIAVANVT